MVDTENQKPGISASLVIVSGNLDIEFANGQLSLFSHELMKRIQCDAKQTKVILDTLTQCKDMVEDAAAAQEQDESTPKPPLTIEDRITRLFE